MDIEQNLREVMARATEADIESGLSWYGRANGLAYHLGHRYGIRPDVAAAVIAVLSPTNKWSRNVADAESIIAWHASGRIGHRPTCCTYGANVAKAERILDGDMGALSGPKVEAFAANIRGDHEFVTLDIWACRAAVKRDTPGRKAERAAIVAAYKTVAREYGYTPAAFQAVIWTIVRGSAH
jgi:hypothetical protein